MQTKQKWALKLTMALGAVSCGGSNEPNDPYMGVIDGTALESKFLPGTCDKEKCYQPMTGSIGGTPFPFYNMGFVEKAKLPDDGTAEKRPVVPTRLVKMNAYDFPGECQKSGKEYDFRTDAYREDVQYPVFDSLPLASSSAPVLPLVKIQSWTTPSKHACNAIKNAQSLKDGVFGGSSGNERIALIAPIDLSVAVKPLTPESTFLHFLGWYRGLQLGYFDGGKVPVDEKGNLKVMDGVFVKPASGTIPKPNESTATLVFQARPGEEAWSPVVRLREFTVPDTASPGDYKSLCYDPSIEGCPAGSIDMSQLNNYSGLLFVAGLPL